MKNDSSQFTDYTPEPNHIRIEDGIPEVGATIHLIDTKSDPISDVIGTVYCRHSGALGVMSLAGAFIAFEPGNSWRYVPLVPQDNSSERESTLAEVEKAVDDIYKSNLGSSQAMNAIDSVSDMIHEKQHALTGVSVVQIARAERRATLDEIENQVNEMYDGLCGDGETPEIKTLYAVFDIIRKLKEAIK